MIFKIIMNFTDMLELVDTLQKDFDMLFTNDQMFISVKDLKTYSIADIRNLISNDNAYVAIIDENNLRNESDKVISWCKDKFIKNDLMRYEKENQEHLKEINTILDKFDENLEKILKERKWYDGRGKKKRKTSEKKKMMRLN